MLLSIILLVLQSVKRYSSQYHTSIRTFLSSIAVSIKNQLSFSASQIPQVSATCRLTDSIDSPSSEGIVSIAHSISVFCHISKRTASREVSSWSLNTFALSVTYWSFAGTSNQKTWTCKQNNNIVKSQKIFFVISVWFLNMKDIWCLLFYVRNTKCSAILVLTLGNKYL